MGHIHRSHSVEADHDVHPSHSRCFKYCLVGCFALVFLGGYYLSFSVLDTFFRAWSNSRNPDFSHLASHCAHISPIQTDSFLTRQQALAETLHALNASAYIAEPGPSATYYANLSRTSWHLSERPLLLIVTPELDEDDRVHAKVSILTPEFEATRAKLLSIPSASEIEYPEWPEYMDPYARAIFAIQESSGIDGPIYVDGETRFFVSDGLQEATPRTLVQNAPVEIRRLRERKRQDELEIMKCANEVTLLSIKAAREHMYIGMHESEAGALVVKAMTAAGLRNSFALSLFGENAALPHGSGTDRVLGKKDFILIDCGGDLHGYESDVTRTFALAESTIPSRNHWLWYMIRSVQSTAFDTALNGTITGDVDEAARKAMGSYAIHFKHRLGHGIGLEGHESPYLRGRSKDIMLTGHVFSNEPGVYIEGDIGIRLEDCFYIAEDGKPVYLTAGVGGQAISPWHL